MDHIKKFKSRSRSGQRKPALPVFDRRTNNSKAKNKKNNFVENLNVNNSDIFNENSY